MLSPKDVVVILINYGNPEDTITCLQALYSQIKVPGAIIVVDNNSPDDSIQRIQKSWQQWARPVLFSENEDKKISPHSNAILLSLTKNNGYASGNNAGILLAQKLPFCQAFWLLNNDTLPDIYALQCLCDRHNNASEPAIIGSTLVFFYDKKTIQCTAGNKFNYYFGLTSPLNQGRDISELSNIYPEDVESLLGFITGASLLFPKDVLKKTGLLREDFFLYLEETELCIRARKQGVCLLWARESIVIHKEGGTTGASSINNISFQRPIWVDYLMLRNRARLIRDHYPLALPLLSLSYLAVACNRFLRKQPQRIPLVFSALWHGLWGKMGKPDCLRA